MIRCFLIICLFVSSSCHAQLKNHFEFGGYGGYKLYGGSINIEYDILDVLTINHEFVFNRVDGLGTSLGLFCYPLKEVKYKPFIGISYNRMFGNINSFEIDRSVFTKFKVSSANYIMPQLGLRYNIEEDDPDSRKIYIISLLVRIGYRIKLAEKATINRIEGPPYDSRQHKIENYISNGLGGSVGFLLTAKKRRHE